MGLRVKGIEKEKAIIVVCEGNFHGRTSGVISFSSDPDAKIISVHLCLGSYPFHTMMLMRWKRFFKIKMSRVFS
jgi:hypothetical protein